MTSRNSFFKMMKEDLRQRLWTIVLAFVVFVLPVPIFVGMEISMYFGSGNGRLQLDLAEYFGMENWWLIVVTVVGAMICAVNGFGYLFSKKKVDFFHALPVKRETLFLIRYVDGVLIYLVPYLAMLVVSFVIIACTGNFTGVVFAAAMEGLLYHLLGYLIVYSTFILCVMFVGNIVVFFAVSGWAFGIVVIALLLYYGFEQLFFDTFSYHSNVIMERLNNLRFLSPGYMYLKPLYDGKFSVFTVILMLWYAAVLAGIALFVYKLRRSEGAGKAIAFSALKPVIRISVELLAGGCIGMLFYNMADRSGAVPGWMIFGTILGVVLCHMLIESVFHYDIRKCFADKLSLVVCAAVTVAFVLVMRYDVFGYDSYLPKKEKLASVGIEVYALDNYQSCYEYSEEGAEWVDELEAMKLKDMDAVYPFLEAVLEENALLEEEGRYGSYYAGGETYVSMGVVYRLKNGREVYREYLVHQDMHGDLFAPVYESIDFKMVHYSNLYTVPAEIIRTVVAEDAMNSHVMTLDVTEKETLLNLLRRDFRELTLREKFATLPEAVLEITTVQKYEYVTWNGQTSTREEGRSFEVPVYASFTETLQFLKDRGFDAMADYEWTGKENVWINFDTSIEDYRLKYGGYTVGEETEYLVTGEDAYWEEKYPSAESGELLTVKPEQWDGDNFYVNPEDYERLMEIAQWETLYSYGRPDQYIWSNHMLYVEVPTAGYNSYDFYEFVIDKDADLSFLFD